MKLRVGDTVKFLNQTGGGKVTKVLSPDMVNVMIEDGFEIPTMVKDLVKIDNDSPLGRYFGESYDVDDVPVVAPRPKKQASEAQTPEPQTPQPQQMNPHAVINDTRKRAIPYRSGDNTFRKGVYLAFVPEDQQYLVTGNLNVYIVNHTESEILYSLFLKSDGPGYNGQDYNTLDPASLIHLDNITRDELNKWSSGIVQVLFHAEKQDAVLSPLTAEFRVQGVRLYKEDNYKETFFFGQKAFVYLLGEIAHQQAVTIRKKELPSKQEKKEVVKAKPQVDKSLIENHKIDTDIAEVDLHISALRSDYGDLKNAEILRFQMDYFQRSLDNAIAKAYRKVVFIHGIGNGVLRDAIIDFLKRNYPDMEYRNASFNKYGYGALEVVVS